jgi:glyoxylate reductase
LIRAGMEVEVYLHDRSIPESELMERIKHRDGLLCVLTDSISRRVIEAGGQLKIIANFAVGYDNIDLPAASEKGIVVSNTPDVLTEATADLAFTLLLSCARRIIEGDEMVRTGRFGGWTPMRLLGSDVFGQTIGIVGTGRIGTAVARRACGFGMKILYSDPKVNRVVEEKFQARRLELQDLIPNSDFISVHVPLSDSTRHLIDERHLLLMKPSAFLINTSRGPVIDERALVKILKNKKIAGAGLDVYEREPLLSPGLQSLTNVVLLPHLGSATLQTRDRMSELAAKNIISLAQNNFAPNAVNTDLLEKMKSPE